MRVNQSFRGDAVSTAGGGRTLVSRIALLVVVPSIGACVSSKSTSAGLDECGGSSLTPCDLRGQAKLPLLAFRLRTELIGSSYALVPDYGDRFGRLFYAEQANSWVNDESAEDRAKTEALDIVQAAFPDLLDSLEFRSCDRSAERPDGRITVTFEQEHCKVPTGQYVRVEFDSDLTQIVSSCGDIETIPETGRGILSEASASEAVRTVLRGMSVPEEVVRSVEISVEYRLSVDPSVDRYEKRSENLFVLAPYWIFSSLRVDGTRGKGAFVVDAYTGDITRGL